MTNLEYAIEILETERLKIREHLRIVARAGAQIQGSILTKEGWQIYEDHEQQLLCSIGVLRSYQMQHLKQPQIKEDE